MKEVVVATIEESFPKSDEDKSWQKILISSSKNDIDDRAYLKQMARGFNN